jgi:hypothetical protein
LSHLGKATSPYFGGLCIAALFNQILIKATLHSLVHVQIGNTARQKVVKIEFIVSFPETKIFEKDSDFYQLFLRFSYHHACDLERITLLQLPRPLNET